MRWEGYSTITIHPFTHHESHTHSIATQAAYFANHRDIAFWMGLVTLRSLRIHEMLFAEYEATMKKYMLPGELSIGPLKQFPRMMVKAMEYAEEKRLKTPAQQVCAGGSSVCSPTLISSPTILTGHCAAFCDRCATMRV